MTLFWSSYQVQIRLILNKSLLGSCLFLFVVFSLQAKICFGSILAAFRKASKCQFTSGSRKIMVCVIINSASCLVWLQKAMILKYWAYLCQRIRPHNFSSKPNIFAMHVAPPCPSCFSFDNKLLTSHVWLFCEGEKIKYIQSINKKERMSLGKKNVAEHEFSCTAGKSCQSLWRISSEASCQGEGAGPPASIRGSFGRTSLTLVTHTLGWGRHKGKEGWCFQPLTLWLFCLSFSQAEGKKNPSPACRITQKQSPFSSSTVLSSCFLLVYSFSLFFDYNVPRPQLLLLCGEWNKPNH